MLARAVRTVQIEVRSLQRVRLPNLHRRVQRLFTASLCSAHDPLLRVRETTMHRLQSRMHQVWDAILRVARLGVFRM